MAPKVYNKRHRTAPRDAVYIGPGSPWGNPFKIGQHGTRAQVIERFRCETLPTLDLRPLKEKSLVCFCAPRPCHGDVLLKAAAAFADGDGNPRRPAAGDTEGANNQPAAAPAALRCSGSG